jgi:hypothetical protein
MTIGEVWDELSLPLADAFESGISSRVVDPGPMFLDTGEVVRECVAMKIAEGSIVNVMEMKVYQLTPAGYARNKPRIDFLRSFGGPVI